MDINDRAKEYIAHVQKSITLARQHRSQLTDDILALPGMSSSLVRHFLNNVCALPRASYLEVGCWQGSTLISALYGNRESLAKAVAIDNWALHPEQNNKSKFLHNIETYLPGYPLQFFEQDCFSVNVKEFFGHPIDIYFYDGNHNVTSHEKAFTHFSAILADTFIAIIDDWNWERVRKGTKLAFEKLNYNILYEQEFFTKGNDPRDWWNGIYIVVITK